MTKTLDKPSRKAHRSRIKRAHKMWSPERRARQAELNRSRQPWLKSTGPKTKAGKAHTAANALKHGFRSRAFIERVREERQLIRDAATTIAVAKVLLSTLSASSTLPCRGVRRSPAGEGGSQTVARSPSRTL